MNIKDRIKALQKNKYLTRVPELKSNKTAREFTTLIFTLIAASIFGLFAVSPTFSTIASLQRDLSDSEQAHMQLEEKIKNLGILQQQYTLLEKDIPLVFQAIPQTPSATILAGHVQSIAQESGALIVQFQVFEVELVKGLGVKKPVPAKGQKIPDNSFAFALSVTGPLSNVSTFAKDLLNFERIITIDSLALVKGPALSENVQLNVRGRAYFLN